MQKEVTVGMSSKIVTVPWTEFDPLPKINEEGFKSFMAPLFPLRIKYPKLFCSYTKGQKGRKGIK